jgi:hypothetical protein
MARIWAFIRANGVSFALELLINVAAPFAIFTLTKPHLGDVNALIASAAPPIAWSLIEFARHRRVDAISMLALAGIALSLLGYFGGGSVKLLQLRERLVTGAIGLIFLGSAAVGRPLIYQLARARMVRNQSQSALTEFENLKDNIYFRRTMMVMTLVWGFGLVIECAVGAALVFVLSISTYLLISPFLGYGVMGALGIWSVLYVRAVRRAGETRRKAALAAAGEEVEPAASG